MGGGGGAYKTVHMQGQNKNKNVKINLNQKYKLKLGWADVAQTQYCRNVRENRIEKSKNLLKSLRKCSLKISTNCKIKEKLESKKNY